MRIFSTLIFCLLLFQTALSQDSGRIVRIRERVVGPVYSGEKIHSYFNGVRTSSNINSLIKAKLPTDIKKSEDGSYITITVTAPAENPLSRYFFNKSQLFYKGKFYRHNEIPDINPATVKEVVYVDSTNVKLSYLKVVTN